MTVLLVVTMYPMRLQQGKRQILLIALMLPQKALSPLRQKISTASNLLTRTFSRPPLLTTRSRGQRAVRVSLLAMQINTLSYAEEDKLTHILLHKKLLTQEALHDIQENANVFQQSIFQYMM